MRADVRQGGSGSHREDGERSGGDQATVRRSGVCVSGRGLLLGLTTKNRH